VATDPSPRPPQTSRGKALREVAHAAADLEHAAWLWLGHGLERRVERVRSLAEAPLEVAPHGEAVLARVLAANQLGVVQPHHFG
jgi:hypothetical protein